MNIVLVSEYFPNSAKAELKGGVESRCFHVARELAKRHDVSVIASYSGGPRTEEFDGIKTIRVGSKHAYSHSGSVRSRMAFVRGVVEAGRTLSPDIVDGYNFLSYLPAHKIAWEKGVKSVATYHDVWLGGDWIRHTGIVTGVLGELWERRVLSKSWDRLIAVSEYTKEKLVANGKSADNIDVIHNGIDFAGIDALSAPKTDRPTITCVSRLVPYKQVDVLVRAMRLVVDNVPDAHCSIIGTGDERTRLERLVKSLKLEHQVTFKGFLPSHDDVLRQVQSSWVFSLPSNVEGFGMSAVEALAAGTPVVCSDIPPIAEATGRKGGFLTTSGDHRQMAEKILSLLTDDKLRKKKAAEGKKHAKSLDWPRIVKQIEESYAALQR